MLKDLSCSLFDAEFGKIRYAQNMIVSLLSILLRQCLTKKCLMHPICLSFNCNRKDQLCELLDVNLHCGGGGWQGYLETNSSWNHFDYKVVEKIFHFYFSFYCIFLLSVYFLLNFIICSLYVYYIVSRLDRFALQKIHVYLTFDVKTSLGEQHCVQTRYITKNLCRSKKNVFGISLISVDFFDYSRVALLISLIFIEFFLIFKNLYIIFQHDLTLV